MEELSSESNLFASGVCPWTQMHIVDILPLEQGNWVIVRLWYMWHLLFKTMSIKTSVCTQENIAKDNNMDPRVSCWLCWLSREGCLVAEKLTRLSEWWESSPARLCRHRHFAQPPAVSPSSENSGRRHQRSMQIKSHVSQTWRGLKSVFVSAPHAWNLVVSNLWTLKHS